jgi:hypothetical protein
MKDVQRYGVEAADALAAALTGSVVLDVEFTDAESEPDHLRQTLARREGSRIFVCRVVAEGQTLRVETLPWKPADTVEGIRWRWAERLFFNGWSRGKTAEVLGLDLQTVTNLFTRLLTVR